jgi:hypothetical protein
MASTAFLARSCISSSVASCIGCGTKTAFSAMASIPSAEAWCRAAWTNSEEATITVGMPRVSYSRRSCTLHDVHEPQSAKAWMTAVHPSETSSRRSSGVGLVKVGLLKRATLSSG